MHEETLAARSNTKRRGSLQKYTPVEYIMSIWKEHFPSLQYKYAEVRKSRKGPDKDQALASFAEYGRKPPRWFV